MTEPNSEDFLDRAKDAAKTVIEYAPLPGPLGAVPLPGLRREAIEIGTGNLEAATGIDINPYSDDEQPPIVEQETERAEAGLKVDESGGGPLFVSPGLRAKKSAAPAGRVDLDFDIQVGDPVAAEAMQQAAEAKRQLLEQREAELMAELAPDPESQRLLKAFRDVAGPEGMVQALDEVVPEIRTKISELDQQIQDIQSQNIDPTRIFKNGVGVAAALGVASGYLSQAILGPGTPNAALNIVQAALDRDLNAQMADLRAGVALTGQRAQLIQALRGSLNDEAAIRAGLMQGYAQVARTMHLQHRQALDRAGVKKEFDDQLMGIENMIAQAKMMKDTHLKGGLIKGKIRSIRDNKILPELQSAVRQVSGSFPTSRDLGAGQQEQRGGGRRLPAGVAGSSRGQSRAPRASSESLGKPGLTGRTPEETQANNQLASELEQRGFVVADRNIIPEITAGDQKAAKELRKFMSGVAGERRKAKTMAGILRIMKQVQKQLGDNTDAFEYVVNPNSKNIVLRALTGSGARKELGRLDVKSSAFIIDNFQVGSGFSNKDLEKVMVQIGGDLLKEHNFLDMNRLRGNIGTMEEILKNSHKAFDDEGRAMFGIGVNSFTAPDNIPSKTKLK